ALRAQFFLYRQLPRSIGIRGGHAARARRAPRGSGYSGGPDVRRLLDHALRLWARMGRHRHEDYVLHWPPTRLRCTGRQRLASPAPPTHAVTAVEVVS